MSDEPGTLADLRELWPQIPWPNSLTGTDVRTGITDRQRRVEICEILASVLWRLQVVAALGPFPSTSMDDTRRVYHGATQGVPWQIWGDANPLITVANSDGALKISMEFGQGAAPRDAAALLQSTLVADAALRLGGLRDLMASVAARPRVFERDAIKRWIESRDREQDSHSRSGALVLAFRDAYMHAAVIAPAEAPGPQTFRSAMQKFRSEMWQRYSLRDIFEASIVVWREICGGLGPGRTGSNQG